MIGAALLAAASLSAGCTAAAIGYARRRNLLDQPGRRRSHTQPTPRGGGIGIVVAALILYAIEFAVLPREARPDLAACAAAVALVALVGWIDDHGGLAARWRLLAHAIAAALVLSPLLLDLQGVARVGAAAGVLAAVVWLALVWSINLHNFMDGINGLLAFQALFVFAAFAVLAVSAGAGADAWHLALLAAAVAAFIPFNFPHARVFMGDVGSGTLGLLIGIAALRLTSIAEVNPFSAPIAVSAFVVDATCNLASRMLRGRRWYSAHREHLYQWLARSGRSHAAVVAWYAGWNLCVVAPVLVWLQRDAAAPGAVAHGASAALVIYAAGTILWICGKRRSLRNVRSRKVGSRTSHASA